MFCRKCGSNIKDNAVFCSKCGEKVEFNSDVKFYRKIKFNKKMICSCIFAFIALFFACVYLGAWKKTIIPNTIAGDFKIYWTDSREDLAGRYNSFKPVNPKNWDSWIVDSGIKAFAAIPISKTHVYFKNDKLSAVVLDFNTHNPKEPLDFFSEEVRKRIVDNVSYDRYQEEYDREYKEYLKKCKINDVQCKKTFFFFSKKLVGIYGEPLMKVENDMSSFFTKDQYIWEKDSTVIMLTYLRDDDFTSQSISLSFKSKLMNNKGIKK